LCVVATGGGAFKFYDKLKEALDVNILREEEMECLIIGRWLGRPEMDKIRGNSH
jgi:pantothenate kinase